MNLKSFNDFILEHYLMLESIVEFSDKFREVLHLVDSPLAKTILDASGEDYPVKSNYFDLGKDEEHISFIADAKAQKTENEYVEIVYAFPLVSNYHYFELFDKLGYDRQKFYSPSVGDFGKVKGKATRNNSEYLLIYFEDNGAKQCVIDKNYTKPYTDFLYNVARQDIRIGRGLRALLTSLGVQFTDAQLEDLVNKFKAATQITSNVFRLFDVVRGSEIAKYYNYQNYMDPNKGELGNSCMKDAGSSFFSIYIQNSAVCQLVILRSPLDETKIIGRALLWKLREPEIMFLDRIYTNKPSDRDLFREYAKKNGWYYKAHNDSSDDPIVVSPEGETIEYEFLEVRIKRLDYPNYPYVDTLKYLKMYSDMYLLSTSADDYGYLLTSTEGYWDGYCEYCQGTGEHECNYCSDGERDCNQCDGRGSCICELCDGDGDIACKDCDGEGSIDGEECSACNGWGESKCDDCGGDGRLPCDECDGEGTQECGVCGGSGIVRCDNC